MMAAVTSVLVLAILRRLLGFGIQRTMYLPETEAANASAETSVNCIIDRFWIDHRMTVTIEFDRVVTDRQVKRETSTAKREGDEY
jgi:hypothetical protein